MEIINNTYRIIDIKESNPYYTTYGVQHIYQKGKTFKLYVFNHINFPGNLIDNLIRDYFYYAKITADRISTVLEFDTIFSINTKPVKKESYYCVVEEDLNYLPLNESIIEQLSPERLLQFMFEILQGFDFLERRKVKYSNINLKTFFISKDEKLIIKDFISNEIELLLNSNPYEQENLSEWKQNPDNHEKFSALGLNDSILDLVAVFEGFFSNKKFSILYKKSLDKIFKKIKYSVDFEKRYSFDEMIQDINHTLGMEVPAIIDQEGIYIRKNAFFFQRGEILSQVNNQANDVLNKTKNLVLFQMTGSYGTGKTRLMIGLSQILSMKKWNIFHNLMNRKREMKENIRDIILDMIDEKEGVYLEKYPKVKNYAKGNGIQELDMSLTVQISEFILETIGDEPTAMFLDEVGEEDLYTREIIRYLSNNPRENTRLLIFFSSNDDFEHIQADVIHSGNLDLLEAQIFIKEYLSMHNLSEDFSNIIYRETGGNTGLIMNVIHELYRKGTLYLKPNGKWFLAVDSFDDIIIPNSWRQEVENLMAYLTERQKLILIGISCLKLSYSAEELTWLLPDFGMDSVQQEEIDQLIHDKILIKSPGINEYYIDFRDSNSKKIVYEHIDTAMIEPYHQQIKQKLETFDYNDNRYLRELIYQCKVSKDYVMGNKVARNLSLRYKMDKELEKAIEAMEYAIDFAQSAEMLHRQMMDYKKLADLQILKWKISDAAENLEKSALIAQKCDRKIFELACLSKLAIIYIDLNVFEAARASISKIRKILNDTSNPRGELEYLVVLGEYDIYLDKLPHLDKIISAMENHLQVFSQLHLEKYLGIKYYFQAVYYQSGDKNLKLSEEYSKKAIEIFEKLREHNWLAKSYNGLGILYTEMEFNLEKGNNTYRKLFEISEKNNVRNYSAIAQVNLGESHMLSGDFKKATEHLTQSLHISKEIKKQNVVFYSQALLAETMLWNMDFVGAKEGIKKTQEELKKYPFQGKFYLTYQQMMLKYYFLTGDVRKAKQLYSKMKEHISVEPMIINEIMAIFSENPEIVDMDKSLWTIVSLIQETKYNLTLDIVLMFLALTKYTPWEKYAQQLVAWLEKEYVFHPDTVANNTMELLKGFANNDPHMNPALLIEKYDEKNDRSKLVLFHYLSVFHALETGNKSLVLDKGIFIYVLLRNLMSQSGIPMKNKSVLERLTKNIIEVLEVFSQLQNKGDIRYLKKNIREKIQEEKPKNYYLSKTKDNQILFSLSKNPFVWQVMKQKNPRLTERSCLISDLKYSNLKNIEMISKEIMRRLNATSLSVTEKKEKSFHDIITLGSSVNQKEKQEIINLVQNNRTDILCSKYNVESHCPENYQKNIFPWKDYVCLPIYKFDLEKGEKDRRENHYIQGFLYISSFHSLNHFNRETINDIVPLIHLMGVFLENHSLSLKYMQDRLTGIYNRPFFDARLKEVLEEANSDKSKNFSVLFMDIDNFKNVNDSYGHKAGDDVLKNFAKIVKNSIRTQDVFARYGGEEFTLFIQHKEVQQGYQIAKRIRKNVESYLRDPEGKKVTVSIGIAEYPEHGFWKDDLLSKADAALYHAKENGKNQVVLWSEGIRPGKNNNMLQNSLEKIILENPKIAALVIQGIEVMKENSKNKNAVHGYIKKILESLEADRLFVIKPQTKDNGSLLEITHTGIFQREKGDHELINQDIVNHVMTQQISVHRIDWDNITRVSELTGAPDWNSVLCTPFVYDGESEGVLYLTTPFKKKEFTHEDALVLNHLTGILGSFFPLQ